MREAYGARKRIAGFIESGVIPKDTLIVTSDMAEEAELFYYTDAGELKQIAGRDRFLSLTEARDWAQSYGVTGELYAVRGEDNVWQAYAVQEDGGLTALARAVPLDTRSLEWTEDGISIRGIDMAAPGQQLRVNAEGTALEWVDSDDVTMAGLTVEVAANTQQLAEMHVHVNTMQDGAEPNLIDRVSVGGAALAIRDKTVDIPVAGLTTLGVVLGSEAENGVGVLPDGSMQVHSVNVNRLVQSAGERMILDCGTAQP